MRNESADAGSSRQASYVDSLSAYSRQHRAQHWEGTLGEFLTKILPADPARLARSSHQYIWDMLRWYGQSSDTEAKDETTRARELFKRELFGVDDPLSRVV